MSMLPPDHVRVTSCSEIEALRQEVEDLEDVVNAAKYLRTCVSKHFGVPVSIDLPNAVMAFDDAVRRLQ